MNIVIHTALGSGTQSMGPGTALDGTLFLIPQQRVFQGPETYSRKKMPDVLRTLDLREGSVVSSFLPHVLHHFIHKGTGRLTPFGGSPSSPITCELG